MNFRSSGDEFILPDSMIFMIRNIESSTAMNLEMLALAAELSRLARMRDLSLSSAPIFDSRISSYLNRTSSK